MINHMLCFNAMYNIFSLVSGCERLKLTHGNFNRTFLCLTISESFVSRTLYICKIVFIKPNDTDTKIFKIYYPVNIIYFFYSTKT